MSAPTSLTPNAATGTAPVDPLAAQRRQNADYLRLTTIKYANVQSNSGGTSGAYSPGTTLNYTVQPVNAGYLTGLRFQCNLTVTGSGTSPTWTNNAAFPYNLIREVDVLYNGMQVRFNPYLAKILSEAKGYLRPTDPAVVVANGATAGPYQDSQIQAMLRSSIPSPIVSGANTVDFTFDLDLLGLHPHDAAGALPIMGEANPVQIAVICNPSLQGADPLINCATSTGGTTPALTASGTVTVTAKYRDGQTIWSPQRLGLDLSNLPTCQYNIDAPYAITGTNSTIRGPIKTLLRHYIVCDIVIDGQQSTQFSTPNNFNYFELALDSTGSSLAERYGLGTNVSTADFWYERRQQFGQDLPEGVFLWVYAYGQNEANASNRMGKRVLNIMPGGWPSIYTGYNLTSIGSVSGISPRVERWLVSSNPAGLLIG